MWIRTNNTDSAGEPVLSRIKVPGSDEYVEFSANGKAQVTSEVGEQLVKQVSSIVPVEDDAGGEDSADGGDESTGTSED